jgi:type II secretory pathway pseudopilin PulG
MRYLFWFCAALIVVSVTMSTNLRRELRAERERAAELRTQITAAQQAELR